MKKVFLFLLLTLPVANLALAREGAGSSGGGDPLIILAEKFSDQKFLQEGVELSLKKVEESKIPKEFKSSFKTELIDLHKAEKLLVLPAIILLGHGGPEDYDLPEDAKQFLALGGMTDFERGAIIYFADRVQTYSLDHLAEVIIHETLHHVMPMGLTDDEPFMKLLTKMIMESQENKSLLNAIDLGGYFRKDYVSREAFLKASGLEKTLKDLLKFGWRNQDSEVWVAVEKELFSEVREQLPKNLSTMTLRSVALALRKTIKKYNQVGLSGDIGTLISKNQIIEDMNKLAEKIDPAYVTLKNLNYFGCKNLVGNFLTRRCGDEFKMGEIYSLMGAL